MTTFITMKSLNSAGVSILNGSHTGLCTIALRTLTTIPTGHSAINTRLSSYDGPRLGKVWRRRDLVIRPGGIQGLSSALTITQVRSLADDKTVKEKVEKYRQGCFEDIPDPSNLPHFKSKSSALVKSKIVSGKTQQQTGVQADAASNVNTQDEGYNLPHPIWTQDQVHDVHVTHKNPEGLVDKIAYGTVWLFRLGFDIFSGFKFGQRNERKWLNRIIFLESVAGVPGMVAAMMRHMKSLRRLQRDQGWIHTLLEEAENERMHLLTALQLRNPSIFFRLCVIGGQGVFVTMFGMCYIVSPRFCHRFVGYLEEEAVKTYTKCLEDIDNGPMQHWKTQAAPYIAIRYWQLGQEATMRDVVLAIRADEAHHRLVNHGLASMKEDEFNPHKPGE